MKVAVMGAGGIGSYLGAMLARAGLDVTLICRGKHLEAIRKNGLSVTSPRESFSINVSAREEPVGTQDVVIHATKLYDLASAARKMLPMLGAHTLVLPIQNGVTAADEVGAIAGKERVVGATVFINSMVTAPGIVSSKSEMNTFVFGEL